MKSAILLITKGKVKFLEDAGFHSCGTREINGETFFQFIVEEKMFEVLYDKEKFSKKDYFFDTRMTF